MVSGSLGEGFETSNQSADTAASRLLLLRLRGMGGFLLLLLLLGRLRGLRNA